MNTVYAISHPVTMQRQYVGVTLHPKDRLRMHLYNSHNLGLRKWVNQMLSQGLTPLFEVLETVPDGGDVRGTESKWISACQRDNPLLFNRVGFEYELASVTKGYVSRYRRSKPDVPVTFTLPKETKKVIDSMALKKATTRRVIVIQAIKMLSDAK
jgi:hypothetical protein